MLRLPLISVLFLATSSLIQPQETAPVITGLSPSSIQAGSGPFTLRVTGRGFSPGNLVVWRWPCCGSSDEFFLGTKVVSSTLIEVPIAASLIVRPVAAKILISDPSSGPSNLFDFTVTANLPQVVLAPRAVGFKIDLQNPIPQTRLISILTRDNQTRPFSPTILYLNGPRAATGPPLNWLSFKPARPTLPTSGEVTADARVLTTPGIYVALLQSCPVGEGAACSQTLVVANASQTLSSGPPSNAELYLSPGCQWIGPNRPAPGTTELEREFQCNYQQSDNKIAATAIGGPSIFFSAHLQMLTEGDPGDWISVTLDNLELPKSATTDKEMQVRALVAVTGRRSAVATSSPPGAAVITANEASATPTLEVDRTNVELSASAGQGNVSTTVNLIAIGGPVAFTAAVQGTPWLSVSPASGSVPAGGLLPLTLTANATLSGIGTHSGRIDVAAPGAPPIIVTLNVSGNTPAAAPVISAVQNGASFREGIAQNTWFAIKGTNLAGVTRIWEARDFPGGDVTTLPTEIEGVRVTVNNRPAYVYYVSPEQLNILAPLDGTQGPVQVQVNRQGSLSNTVTADMQRYAPAFFLWAGRYVASTFPDGKFAGPPNLFPTNPPRPIKPGENVTFWGTGFGQTTPTIVLGKVPMAPAQTAAPVTVRIAGVAVPVTYVGVAPGSAGLYQLNVTIPASTPDGEQQLTAEIGGVQSPPASILVQR